MPRLATAVSALALASCSCASWACGGDDGTSGPAGSAGTSGATGGGASGAPSRGGNSANGGGGSSTAGGTGGTSGAAGTGVGTGGITGASGTGGTNGTSGMTGTSGTGGSAPIGGAGGSGAGGNGVSTTSLPFRYGINYGHLNGKWGDAEDGTLASRAGCTSARVKLPETHLSTWGYDIEIGDMKSYATNGLTDHVAFLSTPTAAHSTMPAGEPEWKLEWYQPAKLYEPIFLPSGEVNPDNPWAAYVYKTVSTYKSYVHTWQVWNEPDWTSDYNVTLTWNEQPPQAKDLPRWNGSIFEYVRLLRVTREAARKADPEARIALGGLGYPSFLGALLRYTDEPTSGAVSPDYPQRGGAYFEVLDYHYYPIFSPGSSDVGVAGFVNLKDEMSKELAKAGVTGKTWNVTETGAPSEVVDKAPGGVVYARSYLAKVMVTAQAQGIGGVDWFLLANTTKTGDAFARMGLYEPIAGLTSVDQAKLTPTGTAYRTLATTLGKARYDAAATAALGPQATDVVAYAFTGDGSRKVVAWAKTKTSEDASGTLTLPANGAVQRVGWDGAITSLAPQAGTIAVALDGSPIVLVGP